MLNPTPEQRRDQVFRARIARLERDNAQLRYALQQIEKVPAMPAPEALDFAAAMAHRACLMAEHDPPNGKIHGFCFVCGIPWPCETANYFLKVTEPKAEQAITFPAPSADVGRVDMDATLAMVQVAARSRPTKKLCDIEPLCLLEKGHEGECDACPL